VIEKFDLNVINETPDGTMIKVKNEAQAREFLSALIAGGHSIVRFELREPSLHEIFVEKVGGIHEED